MPKDNDTVMDVDKYCPNADKELRRIFRSDEVIKALDDNKEFLSNLSLSVGTDIDSLRLVERTMSDLLVEHSRGLKWSDADVWSPQFEAQVVARLKPLVQLYWDVKWSSALVQRVRAGPLVEQLANNFWSLTAGKPVVDSLGKPYKLFVYSTHDTKLAALMNALNVYNNQLIPFGATLLFELHHNGTNQTKNDFFVKLYYHNSTDAGPYLLTLPECGGRQNCPYDRFRRIVEALVPSDWDGECGIQDMRHTMFVSNIVALVINVVLLITLSALIVHNCNRNKHYDYIPIDSSE